MGTDKHWGVLKNTPGCCYPENKFKNSSEEHLVMNNVTYLPGIVSPVQPKAEVATIQGTIFARLYCPFFSENSHKDDTTTVYCYIG